jgi:hypothetical protein
MRLEDSEKWVFLDHSLYFLGLPVGSQEMRA